MNEREKEVLEHLGQEAIDAYTGEGPEFEMQPEFACGDWWYEYCDDCDTYHKSAYEKVYTVTEGSIEEIIWTCDEDGNWETVESTALDDPDYEERTKWYSCEAWIENQRNYLQHVAETGDDPCGEFFVKRSEKIEEKWSVRVFDVGVGVEVRSVRKDNGPWTIEIPEHIREYLMLNQSDPYRMDPATFSSVAQMKSQVTGNWKQFDNIHEFDFTIEHEIPLPEEQIQDELRVRAKRALEEK